MLLALRILGTFNAVIWLGSALFFTFGVAPGVFSTEMKRVFGDYYTGIIAQHLIERYFVLTITCAIVALVHFFCEMVYAGRPFRRFTFGLLVGMLALGLIGGFLFTPKLKELHQIKYRAAFSQQAAAKQQFSRLHAVSRIADLFALIALIIYTWQVMNPPDPTRFVSAQKFRG